MNQYALQIVQGDGWCWVILQAEPGSLEFTEHSAGECEWDTYQAALDNGAVALAKLDAQPYENERADPVGQ